MEEIVFKTRVDTGESAKDVAEIVKEINKVGKSSESVNKADKSFKDINATFDEVYKGLKPMTNRIGEMEDRMYELAAAGKQNTEEFKSLQAETAKFRKVIIETDRSVDQLAEQGKLLGPALQIGTAVAAGYGVAQGAMALFGSESEELEKTLVKLQGVTALLAGLEQLKISLSTKNVVLDKIKLVGTIALTVAEKAYALAIGSTTGAMKLLRIAMLSIPIIAILAGIIALIGVIASFIGSSETAAEANDKLSESFDRQGKAMDRHNAKTLREIDNRLALAKASGKSEAEINKLTEEGALARENIRLNEIKSLRGQIESRRKLYKQAIEEEDFEAAKQIGDQIRGARDKYRDLKALDGQYKIEKQIREAEANKKATEEEKKAHEESIKKAKEAHAKRLELAKAAKEKELALSRTIEDLMIANIADADLRRIEQMRVQQERERAELVAQYGEKSKLINELERKQQNERTALIDEIAKDRDEKQKELDAKRLQSENISKKSELEAKLLSIKEDFDAEQKVKAELAALEREQALQNKDLTEGEKLKIEAEYQDKLDQLKEEKKEEDKKREEELAQARMDIQQKGLESIQNLSDIFFSIKSEKLRKGSAEELAQAKQQFEVNKKLQIAQAIMQGVQGVQAAFASGSAAPLLGAVLGPAYALAAATAAAANIQKIRSTQFQGGSTSVSSPSVPAPQVPQQNQGNQQSQGGTVDNGGSTNVTNLLNKQSNKVVVVDSDIKGVMDNTAKVVSISTVE